jgi:hypothetical protein
MMNQVVAAARLTRLFAHNPQTKQCRNNRQRAESQHQNGSSIRHSEEQYGTGSQFVILKKPRIQESFRLLLGAPSGICGVQPFLERRLVGIGKEHH